jgi:pimeloyl-ACP methyl ester carboxylesterase
VRLIAPDRPGLGRSSRQPGRGLADWPDDVRALADALGIDRFGAVGVSGGGPHALACAWKIPERLSVCGTVSGVAPMAGADLPGLNRQHHAALELARAAPWLVGTVMVCGRFAWCRFPEQMYRRLQALGPRADQTVLARPEVAASLIAGLCEAFRQGSQGAADELGLFIRPWGFPLEAITMPVQIWHGARDGLVPIAAAHRLVDLIPDARLEIVPDGGHYVIYDLIDRLFATVRHDLSRAPHGTSRS